MSQPVPLALVGIGKIARDQHAPTLATSTDFRLVATVSRHHGLDGVPRYATLAAMKAAHPEVAAVAICTPPIGRLGLVREALALGLDILLEKPPAATLSEAAAIVDEAKATDRVLYLSWHAREAAAVAPAMAWLATRTVRSVAVNWEENVRVWHPGQEWIWSPGIGVFDPGINALSVLTRLLGRLSLGRSVLRVPENRLAPIAATLDLATASGAPVHVVFNSDHPGRQRWDIAIETDGGTLLLADGASVMFVDGVRQDVPDQPEYRLLYRHFAELVATRKSDADLAPFRLVADAFLLGEREVAPPFHWQG